MQADFFVLECSHCGSSLRIKMPEIPPAYLIQSGKDKRELRFQIDRYLKKKKMPLTGSQLDIKALYVPYWKIDAVVLKVRNKIVEHLIQAESEYTDEIVREQKMTDVQLTPFCATSAACEINIDIPVTIGMRSEYIKMVPFSRENFEEDFVCLPATYTWDQALEKTYRTIDAVDGISTADFGKNRTELFHPVGSVVYFPYFYIESAYRDESRLFLLDGVSGRVIKYKGSENYDQALFDSENTETEFGRLDVEFHRCLNCGVDLPGQQSYLYICGNCQELSLMEKSSFNMNQINVALSEDHKADQMFPFWSMRLSEEDRKRIQPLFGGIYRSDRLVIPAFKAANFEAMFRLAKRMSSAVAQLDLTPVEMPDGRFRPVNQSLSDALTLAEVIIYREKIGRDTKHIKHTTDFQPIDVSLFYAPFHKQSYFYVDSILGAVTFEKNMAEY